MIQDSEVHGPSYTPMASSSKQNTNQLVVKKSKGSNDSNLEALDSKTEALQAFRTITTMLSLIQSTRGTAGNRPKFRGEKKKLLQLLDAFAAVLIRNHGEIAVTARPYDDSGKVDVLASYLGNGKSLSISKPRSTGPGEVVNKIRRFFISQNPRDPTVEQEEVVDPESSAVPDYFKEIRFLDPPSPSTLLTTFLTKIW
jgi:hypothetical protein